jgi:hypothetical protein
MLALLSLAFVHGIVAPHGYSLLTRFAGWSLDFSLSGGSLWASCTEYHGAGTYATVQPAPQVPWRWSPLEYENFVNVYGARQRLLRVAIWPLWLILSIPTARLWYLRLRRKPGHCRCGYELAGLAGENCPECGRVVVREGA